jgi:hypothetical protein
MKASLSTAVLVLVATLAACRAEPPSSGCTIQGPDHLMPDKVRHVRLGMSKHELESLLGSADYSPIEGLYYFSTGGDCPLEGTDRLASCGVVAEFRDYRSGDDAVVADSLQSCWWGAIAE